MAKIASTLINRFLQEPFYLWFFITKSKLNTNKFTKPKSFGRINLSLSLVFR